MSASITLFTKKGGSPVTELSAYVTAASMRLDRKGPSQLSVTARVGLWRALPLFASFRSWYVEVSVFGYPIWGGRVEDIDFEVESLRIVAFGQWLTLFDRQISEAYVDDSTDLWFFANSDFYSVAEPSRFVSDNNNRIYTALVNGDTYDTSNRGAWFYFPPDQADNQLSYLSFDYDVNLPSGYRMTVYRVARISFTATILLNVAGTGSSVTGSYGASHTADDGIMVLLVKDVSATYTGNTGDSYIKMTNIVVAKDAASVNPDDIAADLVGLAKNLNDDQITMEPLIKVNDSGVSGTNVGRAVYQDTSAGAALLDLEKYGVFVEFNRFGLPIVHAGAPDDEPVYYITIDPSTLRRSMTSIANSVRASYTGAPQQKRTSYTTDDDAVDQYGFTRQVVEVLATASQTKAQAVRDYRLEQRATDEIQGDLNILSIRDASGARVPIWAVKPGARAVVSNLPPLGSFNDLLYFDIDEVEIDLVDERLTLRPGAPLGISIDVLIAEQV